MARQVSISRFQQMQQAAAEEDAEATTRLKEIGYGPIEPETEQEHRVAGRAEALAAELGKQLSYDVDADGLVLDVRAAEMTPDRGVEAGDRHVYIRDEDGNLPQFSGAGADDESTTSKIIPSDRDFNGKLYREAPELALIAELLIAEHGFLAELVNCDIRWYWRRKTGVSKGRVKIGFMKRASDLLGHFSGADFIGWLSATTARDGKFTDQQVEAAVFHQLCHVGSDDNGNWIFAPHDFEGFAAEVRAYGTWTSDLKLGGTAFVAAHQMGLFDAADEDEDEDDEITATASELDDLPTDEQIDAARAADDLADDDL